MKVTIVVIASLVALLLAVPAHAERMRMVAYECQQIDEAKFGFMCSVRGGSEPRLVITLSEPELQQSSADARYQRWSIIYSFIDHGGTFFNEIIPAQNRQRACSRIKGGREYSCHEWYPIEE